LTKHIGSLVAVTLLFALTACGWGHHRKGPEVGTPYAAVLLDSGQVYYGKLTHAGSKFPELTDVYYIQTQVNQETKATSNILVRRGNEWHGPDRMFLNERHIILIEPVGTNSKVAELIQADKNKH
jgi:outer membrane lipopolysaccharide assembly protein LptE/RlpB